MDEDATSWSTTKEVALIVGGSFLLLLLVTSIIVIAVIFYRFYKRKHEKFYDNDSWISKSEPLSRNGTPKQERRLSCPTIPRSPTYKSASSESLEHEFLTLAERVQPKSSVEQGNSNNAVLEEQYNFIDSLPVERSISGARTSDEECDSVIINPGSITFSATYNHSNQRLIISLISADSLPGRGRHHCPRNPFVKIYLLPDEETCHMSKTCQQTLNPVFNESFDFSVNWEDILQRTLRLSLYDVDKRRVRHSLGHVFLPLSEIDFTTENIINRPLEKMPTPASILGEIQVSLTCSPNEGTIKLVINRARNIQADAPNGIYMMVSFYYGRRICKTKRTAVKKGTSDPDYNESFSFNIKTRQIDACSIVITAYILTNNDSGQDDVHGHVTLGPFTVCRGEQLQHWNEVMINCRQTITKWHRFTSPSSSNPE